MSADSVPIEDFCRIPLFHNLNDSECHQFAEISRVRSFEAGEPIVEQSDDAQNLWVVLQGRCEVIKHLDGEASDGQIVLAVLEPYGVFGEMSFFHKARHSASVRAQSDVKLLQIRRRDYDELIEDEACAAYKVAFNTVASLAQRLRRMDDWVAELIQAAPANDERQSEWNHFRHKMLSGWNL